VVAAAEHGGHAVVAGTGREGQGVCGAPGHAGRFAALAG
jgi:hypothetical protein